MKRLLWIGDAGVSTGFARCTHKILDRLKDRWEVHVLGINYRGDPHSYQYPIYPCWPGGDLFGVGRTAPLINKLRPDIVVIQNDPWNLPDYLAKTGNVPVAAVLAVDGKNCRGAGLNGLALAIFWTEFGQREAHAGGYRGRSTVIPLGVDTNVYRPVENARNSLKLPDSIRFLAGNVNRNQPRKRLDLTVSYFSEWIKTRGIEDAYLFLHIAPTGDAGYDVAQLAQYYKVANRLIMREPEIGHGDPEEMLNMIYNTFDVQISTTQGEGWGLTTLEGMACGVHQIAPDWAALGEWAADYADLVPCTEICVTPNNINAVGGVPDRKLFLEAMDRAYKRDRGPSERNIAYARSDTFSWDVIAESYHLALSAALE